MQMKFKGGSVKSWLLRVTCGGWSDLLTKQRPASGSLASGAASKDHVTATCWRSRAPSHAYSQTPIPSFTVPSTQVSISAPLLTLPQTNQQFFLFFPLVLSLFTLQANLWTLMLYSPPIVTLWSVLITSWVLFLVVFTGVARCCRYGGSFLMQLVVVLYSVPF